MKEEQISEEQKILDVKEMLNTLKDQLKVLLKSKPRRRRIWSSFFSAGGTT